VWSPVSLSRYSTKVGIPDGVLLKPGRLDAEEFALIRTHAEIGKRIPPGPRP
jgi:putative two-component system response regulator